MPQNGIFDYFRTLAEESGKPALVVEGDSSLQLNQATDNRCLTLSKLTPHNI